MIRTIRATAAALAVALVSAPGPVRALAAAELPPELVESRLASGRSHAWTSRFEARLEGGSVQVRVGVHLVPAAGVTRLQLERALKPWRVGAEERWSGRFALETAGGVRYPIRVSVDFHGPSFHHDVVVGPGAGRTDQLDWHLADPPSHVAHEIGHMLGANDEYRGGAVGPGGAIADTGSLMGASPGTGALPRARHFEGIRQWFAARTGTGAVIVPLGPGPAAEAVAWRGGEGR